MVYAIFTFIFLGLPVFYGVYFKYCIQILLDPSNPAHPYYLDENIHFSNLESLEPGYIKRVPRPSHLTIG